MSDDTFAFALSFSQQRLWFLEQLQPGTAAYNLSGAVRLVGQLDVDALRKTLSALVARHEVLRTTFATVDGAPVQLVAAQSSVALPLEDFSREAQADRDRALDAVLADEAQRLFDLERGPLFRARLYRLGEQDHVLQVSLHHIIADGWSLGVLVRDLGLLYAGYASGQEPSLPELPIQYADYAAWQREQLQSQTLQESVGYWRGKLAGLATLELPTDHPRPAAPTFEGALHTFLVPASLASRLIELGREEGATLFMTLLASFSVLLSRYSGQLDVVVGSPIAGRGRAELEPLIGFFVNNLVLRTDLTGAPSFRALLRRVRRTALEAYTHQDVPFERLVEELHPQRDPGRNPLFQVMLGLQNTPYQELVLPRLSLSPLEVARRAAAFDLTLQVLETKAGLRCSLEYATDLFEAETIERMAGHLVQLLSAAVQDPELGVAELPLLTPAELSRVAEWNATESGYPKARLHELIWEQAGREPERVAVECQGRTLRYRELLGRADSLATRLRGLGVGPGVLVGIYMERSAELLVAVLAVLRAGGAYVPLDPSYPLDRLEYMVQDSGLQVLLSQRELSAGAPKGVATLVEVDAESCSGGGAEALEGGGDAEDLAYVIYTSGSTGKPKGVAVTHRALVNLLASMRREPGLAREDVLLSVTTLSFDIAGLELYLPLLVGARVLLATREEASDGARLRDLLAGSGATAMQATPATWRLLLESGWKGDGRLKILCGGEALSRELAEALLSRGSEVWNVYGPTETTIWSSVWRVEPQRPVTIGRPIANTRMYVLDAGRRLQPVGIPGELYIGGDGLARGYWQRPELTAERFVPDPFRPGGRLYRTGDLARWLPDGCLDCLGRLDHQVKVRGFRIELGEIEAALQSSPGVEAAVVLAPSGLGVERQLVAYLAHGAAAQPNVTELRAHLKRTLPVYMVPSSFVFVDKLPLTPNGKLDRQALAGMDAGGGRQREAFVAPRTPMEIFIADVWKQVLGVERVGLRDNFFDLGGHSLLAMRTLAPIEKRVGRRINPGEIVFQTLEQLAASCEAAAGGEAAATSEGARGKGLGSRLIGALRSAVPSARAETEPER